ncbi:hypothetical protein GCM10022254_75460 [Actinomadura meridiana]|uniref:Uncharacterized protein n=1 Tax=Actinomadura meridiana TaxID=559626 RepID=A0ABP8CSK8_9ACTN
MRGWTGSAAGPGGGYRTRKAAEEAEGGGQPGHPHVCPGQGGGSRGTRTHNLRIKSRLLSYQNSALSVRLYRSVHIQHHLRAATSRSVPVRFETAEQTTSRRGRTPVTVAQSGAGDTRLDGLCQGWRRSRAQERCYGRHHCLSALSTVETAVDRAGFSVFGVG